MAKTVTISGADALSLEARLLCLPVHEEDLAGKAAGPVAALDAALDGHLLRAARAEAFAGKAGEALSLPTLGKVKAERVTLLGMGPRAVPGTAGGAGGPPVEAHEALRMAVGKAARGLKGGRLVVALSGGDLAGAARAAVEGALLGAYRFERYRSEKKEPGLTGVIVAVPGAAARGAELKAAVALGESLAGAVAWARDLVNLGPAECTPSILADTAVAAGKRAGLQAAVLGPRQIAALKMGMFLGVTRGSAEPARLVTLSYVPRGAAARKRKPVVLVGKAITFDSGGLSLKPSDSMITMNTDMAGSAAVVAAMQVIAGLAPDFPVHAVFGACENMPGGRAYKPSDVLTAFDGQTVEITNTDAEGRLVLGDVLAWAAKTYRPAAMIDVATLTGACMVALGWTTAGAMGPDGPVVDGLLAAAARAGEEAWRLPLCDSLKENLKSDRADMKNAGDRMGGAMSAALFLQKFVKGTPWAHLDIAGPSHSPKERGYVAKGGTGYAVRTLVEFVRGWKG